MFQKIIKLMQTSEIIEILKSKRNETNKSGMARFGINTEFAFGISMPELTLIAKKYKKNHNLALELWDTGYHEAKILAAVIDDPKQVTEEQMEKWVLGINSWDVCDQLMMKLFDKTEYATKKIFEWAERKEEFVKRSAFALIASVALHDKKSPNDKFESFLPLIIKAADDERNFVKKAVNWALRQIGKKNKELYFSAFRAAEEILSIYPNSKSARWIANDAIREFNTEKIKLKVGVS